MPEPKMWNNCIMWRIWQVQFICLEINIRSMVEQTRSIPPQLVWRECNLFGWSPNQSKNFVSFVLSVLHWIKLHRCLAVMQSPNKGQKFTLATWLHSSVSDSFIHITTTVEFRNDSYILSFYMLGTFSNVSWQLQLNFLQLQTKNQTVDIRIVFTLT